MNYIDGFVIAVPASNKEQFIQHAQKLDPAFKDYGALRVVECWGDNVPNGKLTSFPMAVQLKPDEVVVFSWIEWPSKQVRDAGMEKIMADPRFTSEGMPFDGKRMIFGGFQMVVEI